LQRHHTLAAKRDVPGAGNLYLFMGLNVRLNGKNPSGVR